MSFTDLYERFKEAGIPANKKQVAAFLDSQASAELCCSGPFCSCFLAALVCHTVENSSSLAPSAFGDGPSERKESDCDIHPTPPPNIVSAAGHQLLSAELWPTAEEKADEEEAAPACERQLATLLVYILDIRSFFVYKHRMRATLALALYVPL